jgi:uncharacterized membrane protein
MRIALNIHIISGAMVLLLGLAQILLRKSGRRHRIVGSLFSLLMIVTSMSALGISMYKLFVLKEIGAIFLLTIGCFSLYLTLGGWMYAHYRTQNSALVKHSLLIIGALFSVILVGTTIYFFSINMNAGFILGTFSMIQTLLTIQDFRVKLYSNDTQEWLRLHIIRMISSYIAATTAFLVNAVEAGPVLLKWLGPSILGTMVIIYFTRKKSTKVTN